MTLKRRLAIDRGQFGCGIPVKSLTKATTFKGNIWRISQSKPTSYGVCLLPDAPQAK
jgi:hypothetical protein